MEGSGNLLPAHSIQSSTPRVWPGFFCCGSLMYDVILVFGQFFSIFSYALCEY